MYRRHPLNPEFGRSRRMGFHLTAGVFFPLIGGGHLLYRSAPNGEAIDYTLPVGVAGPAAQSVTEFTFSPHEAEAVYRYGLRAVARCGCEDTGTACVTEVGFNAGGDRDLPRPNAPYALQAKTLSKTQTQLSWRYDPTNQAAVPVRFGVIRDDCPDLSFSVTYTAAVQLYTGILTHAYAAVHRFLVYAITAEGKVAGTNQVWAAYDDAAPPTPGMVMIEKTEGDA